MINNEKEFLAALTKLSKKHSIVIGGCGCCGSPWISDAKDSFSGYHTGDHYEADKNTGSLTWTKLSRRR